MDFPTPVFTPWFSWSELDQDAPTERTRLCRVGCYLIAVSDSRPHDGPARMDAEEIVYIGETHGDTCSLWGRLGCFGNSAGFYGQGQKNGHYAAWDFPYVQGARGQEVRKGIWKCESGNVWVAVCAWEPGRFSEKRRGLFPTAVEQRALWTFARERGELPMLNNTGRVRVKVVPPMPQITDQEINHLLCWATAPRDAEASALAIAERLAKSMKYRKYKARLVAPGEYGQWTGVEQRLESSNYLYIGKSAFHPAAVTLTAFEKERCTVDSGESATVEQFRSALAQFWDYWSPS